MYNAWKPLKLIYWYVRQSFLFKSTHSRALYTVPRMYRYKFLRTRTVHVYVIMQCTHNLDNTPPECRTLGGEVRGAFFLGTFCKMISGG